MFNFIWPVARVVALRLASMGLDAALSTAGRLLLTGAFGAGLLWGWTEWQRAVGRQDERDLAAKRSLAVEALAYERLNETVQLRAERVARETAELAAQDDQEKRVRDANPGNDILWPATDGWLRSKYGKAGGR